MDLGPIILSALLLLAVGWGMWDFFGEKATVYRFPIFTPAIIFAGILFLVVDVTTVLWKPFGDQNEYIISYICFGMGLLFAIGGLTIVFSDKANKSWWKMVNRLERGNDRRGLVFILFVGAFAFFFSFFLFYPPFISIG